MNNYEGNEREGMNRVEIGRWVINRANRSVKFDGESVDLTSGEFDIFWCLAQKAGQVVSRDDLFNEILKMDYDGLNRSIDIRIARLRKKLKDNIGAYRLILSIRGEGYQLAPGSE